MEDGSIAALMELYNIIKADNALQTTDTVKQILGRKAISFEQFARYHVSSFT